MTLTHLKKRYGPWGLVTGASDGIGREMAIRMAEAGLNVILVARRASVLQHLADDLIARYGIEAKAVAADLADARQVSELVSLAETYDLGLFVAAAGFGTSGLFLDQTLASELEMLDVNCRAVVQLCHGLGRQFVSRKRGGIILFSSIVAFQGVPRAAHYAATKAHIQTFAEGCAASLRRSGSMFSRRLPALSPAGLPGGRHDDGSSPYPQGGWCRNACRPGPRWHRAPRLSFETARSRTLALAALGADPHYGARNGWNDATETEWSRKSLSGTCDKRPLPRQKRSSPMSAWST
ncbi:SDR family NAD(P)-dependent oxidoreductase [Elstera litoralis]|uniref:SDR family NAD(P)-dependent oxidoreductase n=1 Tax=Elstera litoralis TaxID=552518 RepID=UPI000A983C32|nr:SDR family NAD(P)-dependent oxidoreductase [Elstera litoralis]